jgi:hypothetical protein
MLFLTYVQGKLVQPWVIVVTRWLVRRVTEHGINTFNLILWTDIEDAFCRQFVWTP